MADPDGDPERFVERLRRSLELLLERSEPGPPEILSTRQAADYIGFTTKRWRRWAKDGKIEGAFQDERDRWRLPRKACREFVAEKYNLREGGRRGPHAGRSSSP